MDREGRVYAWKVTPPPNYEPVLLGVEAALRRFENEYTFAPEEKTKHARGDFTTAKFGSSFGGGQKVGAN